jgi:integrase
MPSRSPWLHVGTGYWCVKIKGRRVYLDKDHAKACQKLARLLAGEPPPGDTRWLGQPLTVLADQFLADVQALRSAGTYRDYSDCLARAFQHIEANVTVGAFGPQHLRKVEQELVKAGLNPTTVCKTLHAVQRVFTWAVKPMGFLTVSPVAGYERPAPRERSRIVNDREFQAMLRASDAAFRRFLLVLRLTGCRPGELRKLVWEWVDLEAGVWTLPEHKTVTRQKKPRPRIIALTPPILALCRWLAARRRPGVAHVFLNRRGRPWSKSAVVSRLRRLRHRAGLEPKAGERITLYCLRHSYCTHAVGKVADLELAELVGHTTARTLRRYFHADVERLKRIAQRVGRAAEDA